MHQRLYSDPKPSFLPLQNLTFTTGGIRITERNAVAYDGGCCDEQEFRALRYLWLYKVAL